MAHASNAPQTRQPDLKLAGISLDKKYADDLAEGELDRYARRLARDGLAWWCELDVDKLARHLTVLREMHISLPPRLGFLDEILDHSLSQPGYLAWYERFQSERDHNAATVVVAAALADIWLSGEDFRRQEPWQARAHEMLATSPAPITRAAMLAYAGLLELLGEAGVARARETLAACRQAADEAQSLAVRLLHASFETYALVWSGEYATAEVMLTDASALACRPETPRLAGLFLRSSLCLFLTLRGDAGAARHLLHEEVRQFDFGRLQAMPRLMVLSNLLHADAMEGDEVAAEALAERLHKRIVAPGKYFYHVMLHMALGTADLLLGRPAVALAHARGARSLNGPTHSPLADHLPILLELQARLDIGDNEGALRLAEAALDSWLAAGLVSIASTALVEMAVALQRLGQPDRARTALERARSQLPTGEALVLWHRNGDYLAQVVGLLMPSGRDAGLPCDSYPVAIHALGELRVRVGARLLFDRDWRGERAKSLLKALLVLGGRKVPSTKLARLLWPDAEEEQARGNLKVALWRLRRLGTEQGETALPWLLTHNGQISLANGVVDADALTFQALVETAVSQRPADREALVRALDLYGNDFLAGDDSDVWILDHRLRLRDLFLTACRALADHAGTREELEQATAYLERGRALDPLDERTAERLMICYLKLGYPGRVLTFFRELEGVLNRDLGIRPGAALLAVANRARQEQDLSIDPGQ